MTHPDTDFPYTMYFCGEPMPKWAAQWYWVAPTEDIRDPELWQVLYWRLLCRIDHVGGVETEDALIFRVAAQHLLISVVADMAAVRSRLTTAPGLSICDVDAALHGITDGLVRMIIIAHQRSLVAWTSGYEADRQHLLADMARMELPPNHPEHMFPPHTVTRESELKGERDSQVRRLHQLAESGHLTKHMRTMLYQIERPNQQV